MKTPKQMFLEDKARAGRVGDIVASDDMQHAIHAAFAQLCYDLPAGTNPAQAWDANSIREGAKRFIGILAKIHDPGTGRKVQAVGVLGETE
jgi:hypothetical protein